MKWENVTFKQYLEVVEIQKRNDDNFNKILDTIAVLKDIDVNEITINNYKDYTQEIAFLNTDIPIVPLKEKYDNYVLIKQIENISMKQYMDFQVYANLDDYVGILTCFLIPENKEYNEGYDIEQVKEYINTMSVQDVMSIYSFFLIYSTVFMEHLKISLHQKQIQILKKKKAQRRRTLKTKEILRLYCRLHKKQMKHILRYCKCAFLKCFTSFRTLLKRTKEK